ncbi:ABC transporter ATP-binding protein [Branchiibius sp. NY16-3462-2]|uniref:ABC transporter ATP-binding protein n=1 Tax=Branchiibius sp. NY16-3462-2 TaxID=1807500 RepID=UPI00079B26DB|nr:ABC transporter ATP-binding protein [Branchiibius sp. NY16-3462-2]KYH43058.1 hypothetical protein AZH51_06305 [Branchiibius sp. NY16-3462-2]
MISVLRSIRSFTDRRFQVRLALVSLGNFIAAMMDMLAIALVYPIVNISSGAFYDAGVMGALSRSLGSPQRATFVAILAGIMVGLFLLKDLLQILFNWWSTALIYDERAKTSVRLLSGFLHAPYTQIAQRPTAELIQVLQNTVTLAFNYALAGSVSALTSVVSLVAMAVVLFVLAPLPTVGFALYLAVAGVIFVKVLRPRTVRAGRGVADFAGQEITESMKALGATKEIHLRNVQDVFIERYAAASYRRAYADRMAGFLGSLPRYYLEIVFILGVGVLLALSSLSQSQGNRGSVGLLAVFVAAGFRTIPSASALLGSLSNVRVGVPALEAMVRDLDRYPASAPPAESADSAAGPLHEGTLRLEQVSFRYPDATTDALSAVDLAFEPGSSTAFVGSSGAGKSTLVDLILGLHTPTDGQISLDGVDLATAPQQWRGAIGYVPQDVFLFTGTLAENIAFDQDPTQIDRIRLGAAVRGAELNDLVQSLPNGLDSQVGERGSLLSGGQRQRVGIARALYRQPTFLVLDEATSALDNETEHRIARTINDLEGSMTIIVVAHRLSTVRNVDRVVYLDHGRVAAVGSFEDVIAASPGFARMVKLGGLSRAG